MITIIHGDDILNSRKLFGNLKDKSSLSFDAINLDPTELKQSLQNGGLFEETKKIFIENLFSKKATKNYEIIIEIINSEEKSEIYLYSDKELGKNALKELKNSDEKLFKIPKNIFTFVDNIKPKNSLNLKFFHESLISTDVEIVFSMIVRQFRLMIALSESSKETIDEVKRLAPWQKSKLEKQASLFGLSALIENYIVLCKIDKETKTGKTPLSLSKNIDIFLLQI